MRPRLQPMTAGFTLIELLVTIAIIAVLAGLLLPALGLVRGKVRRQEAKQVVAQLAAGLRTYQHADRRHRYPLEEQLYPAPSIPVPHGLGREPQGGAVAGVLALLIDLDAGVATSGRNDAEGRLLDPWGRPYRYQLTRPAPAAPAGALADWNWNAETAAPKAWNAISGIAAPYPYVWSAGADGSDADASGWIYEADR